MFKTAELGYLKDKYLYPMSLLIFILLEIVITFLMLICMYTYIDNFSNLTHVQSHTYSLPWQLRELGKIFLINVHAINYIFLNTGQDMIENIFLR